MLVIFFLKAKVNVEMSKDTGVKDCQTIYFPILKIGIVTAWMNFRNTAPKRERTKPMCCATQKVPIHGDSK